MKTCLYARILLAAALLVVVIFGYRIGERYWSADAPAAVQRHTGDSGAPEMLPEFTLKDLEGTPQRISQWSGHPLLINFWATWCAPCRREMPLLQKLHEAQGDGGLKVIGIAIDHPDSVATFVAETGVTYPILAGEEDAMAAADLFGADFVALPFSVFVAPDGEILRLYLGEIHPDDLKTILGITLKVTDGQMSVAQARAQLEKI